jgi:hypothetical protein
MKGEWRLHCSTSIWFTSYDTDLYAESIIPIPPTSPSGRAVKDRCPVIYNCGSTAIVNKRSGDFIGHMRAIIAILIQYAAAISDPFIAGLSSTMYGSP